ncbi:MAG: hypothetical protein AABY22_31685 [Nanoarchaeota archaeon]
MAFFYLALLKIYFMDGDARIKDFEGLFTDVGTWVLKDDNWF